MTSCDHDSDNVHTMLQIETAMAYPCTCMVDCCCSHRVTSTWHTVTGGFQIAMHGYCKLGLQQPSPYDSMELWTAKDGMGMGQDSFPDSPIKVCERDYRDVSGLISRLLETRLGVACICPPVRA